MQNIKIKAPLNPSKVLAIGFFAIIAVGSLLLKLPFAVEDGVRVSLLQAVFTATSAVCVTGLTVVDTVNSYSLFGELVILCLIQLGGLGFMFFATSVLVLTGRRISLRNRMLLHETMSMPGLSGSVRMTMRFMLIVMAIEITGSIILASQFVPLYGFWKGTYYGVFHAISAFCNAGFDLFGTAGSLISFNQQPAVLLTVSGLIIIGGLGFTVLADLLDQRFRFKKLHLHSKIVLTVSGFLLAAGTLLIAMIEWNNPETLAHAAAGPYDKVMNAWFQSTAARTAGFSSFWQANLHDSSKLVTIVLMFIGASPASTGGGIKTTTVFTLVMLVRSVFHGREDVSAFNRRLSSQFVKTALSIFFISMSLLAAGGVIMSLAEHSDGYRMIDLIFEETSALATVGLSSADTMTLSDRSQLWLILLMYFGRIGPLTMMLSLSRRNAAKSAGKRYPEEQIIVG